MGRPILFEPSEYELLGFGNRSKLERFGGVNVQRPCPAASNQSRAHRRDVDLDYRLAESSTEKGDWSPTNFRRDHWSIRHNTIRFLLKPTPFGHLGVFPEQATNWDWLRKHAEQLRGCKALNLFAYTGGTTMTLASLGCEVTHVDSARNIIKWARENAELSELGKAPIRWIAEDVMRFVKREIKRERFYDVIVADPPSFGRGPKKETWKIERDFADLVEGIRLLTRGSPRALLFSGHTVAFDDALMKQVLQDHFSQWEFDYESDQMRLSTKTGDHLYAGHYVRAIQK